MRRDVLLRRGLRFERLTIGWNGIEALVALGAGWQAASAALIGFGLDSVIETVAAVALYLRLRAELAGAGRKEIRRYEHRALRLVGVTFLLLGLYITYEASHTLVSREPPSVSAIGIGLAVLSLLVMPALAWAKHRTGRELGSAALIADARETLVCAYLSFTLLLGLGLNALAGWWWADPLAALAMVPFVVREGIDALAGD